MSKSPWDDLLDDSFRKLLGGLPLSSSIPELAYGTLPTAMAIRNLKLGSAHEAQRIAGNTGIPSEEAFGSSGTVHATEVVAALKFGSLELPPLVALPSNEEIIEVASRVEDLLRQKTVTQTDLLSLSARQFEEFIAETWARLGYDVELTAHTRDGGKDIVAVRRSAEAKLRFLIECKRYRPDRKIGIAIVRELYAVKIEERATKAFLATTSTFSKDASRFIGEHLWELEGHDYRAIIDWAVKVASREDGRSN